MSARRRRLQTARDISQLLKQQWRPGLLALCLLIVDMIYWLFYFIEAKKLEGITLETPWFNDWLACLGSQAMEALTSGRLSAASTIDDVKAAGHVAQETCAIVAAPYVPSFTWAALADIMPAVFGIMILIIFGTKLELWQDLRRKIFGKRDSAVLTMGDITKEEEGARGQHRRPLSPDELQHQNYHSHSTKAGTQTKKQQKKNDADFYSEDFGLAAVSRPNSIDMMLIGTAHGSETPRYGGKQSRSRSGSHVALPAALFTEATYGGATRKTSATIQDDREPIYYRKPEPSPPQQELFQKHLLHDQHAKLMTEGAVPWPSWPSSTSTTSSSTPTSPASAVFPSGAGAGGARSSSFDRYASSPPPPSLRNLTIDTAMGKRDRDPPPHATFPTLPVSPQQKGFYNSEDISAQPIPLSQPSKINRQLSSPYCPPPSSLKTSVAAIVILLQQYQRRMPSRFSLSSSLRERVVVTKGEYPASSEDRQEPPMNDYHAFQVNDNLELRANDSRDSGNDSSSKE
ncbi:hypothetical protein EC991_007418 [Linnemannia zychae]|nr:hypothetical protein EC991_007418 [Linnemannia zychae]